MAKNMQMNTHYAKPQALIQLYALNVHMKLEIGHTQTVHLHSQINIFWNFMKGTKH